MSRLRLLFVVDHAGSSLGIVTQALAKGLSDEFTVEIKAYKDLRSNRETDLLVCFWWGITTQVMLRVKSKRVVLAVCDHDSWRGSPDTTKLLQAMAWRTHQVVVADETLASEMALAVPVAVCHDGVDISRFTPGPLPVTFTAGWCGDSRRAPGGGDPKGVDLLREACDLASVPFRVRDAAQGLLPYDQMPAWHQGNSVYLCGSISETTPLPVLEALASGRPVISTAVGQVPRLVLPGVSGLLVDRTPEAFEEALQTVRGWNLSEHQSACRATAETRSTERMVQDWRKVLHETWLRDERRPERIYRPNQQAHEIPAFAEQPAAPGDTRPLARIVAHENGRGLSRDIALLRPRLEEGGYRVIVSPPTPGAGQRAVAHLQVFLEQIAPEMLEVGERNVVIPNPEFFRMGWLPLLRDGLVEVWAKTHHAAEVFGKFAGVKVTEIGFTSSDRLDASVRRERTFLHVAGQSHRKGTHELLAAWQADFPPLTVVGVGNPAKPLPRVPENVTIHRGHVGDSELRRLQNQHLFHLCPSLYEGFGHTIWEGLSCGAVVLLPTGPPFINVNDAGGGAGPLILVREMTPAPSGLVDDSVIATDEIQRAVRQAMSTPLDSVIITKHRARRHFEQCRAAFDERLADAIEIKEAVNRGAA